MIDIQKDTPIEYSKQSRDYQVFSFLYSALFNQVKLFADQIENIWTDNIDDKLLLPRSYTLNFIPKYDWDNDDLRGVTNNFRYLLRTKGTTDAIKACLEILARLHNASIQGIEVEILGPGHIRIIIGEEISDFGIIDDLLRYILPAGITYEVVKYANVNSTIQPTAILVNSKFESVEAYDNSELYIPHFSTMGVYPTGGSNEQYAIEYSTPTETPDPEESIINSRVIDKSGKYVRGGFDARFAPGMLVTNDSNTGLEIYIKGAQVISGYTGSEQVAPTGTNPPYTVMVNKSSYDPNKLHYVGSPNPKAKGTNIGTYYMGLKVSDFTYDGDASIYVEDGFLQITGGSIVIEIAGNTITIPYNGLEQSIRGYTSSSPNTGYIPSKLSYKGSAIAKGKNVGTYYMNLDESLFDYKDSKFSFVDYNIADGYIKIIPLDVNIDISGNTLETVYNGSEQSVSNYSFTPDSPLYTEDYVEFTGTKIAKGTNIGTYTMDLINKFSNISDNFNATFNVQNGYLVIKPKDVTVEADEKTKVYGHPDPALTATISGAIQGEEPLINYTLTRGTGENVATYVITASGQQNQGNYIVSFNNNNFIIVPADWSISSPSVTKEYDGYPIDRGVCTVSGLQYSDTVNVNLTSNNFTSVGTYTNSIRDWTFTSGASTNYNQPSIVNGTLTITKAPAIKFTVDDITKVYDGTQLDSVTYRADGIKYGDSVTININKPETVNVGTRPIPISYTFNLDENNYESPFIISIGNLVITARPASIVCDNNTKTFGDQDPTLTGTVTNLVNPTDLGTISYTRTAGETVGTYVIKPTYASNDNYTVSTTDGTFTISKRSVTITAADNTITVSDPIPVFSATVTNAVDLEPVNYVLNCDYSIGDPAGDYPITVTYTESQNYNISTVAGTLHVTD